MSQALIACLIRVWPVCPHGDLHYISAIHATRNPSIHGLLYYRHVWYVSLPSRFQRTLRRYRISGTLKQLECLIHRNIVHHFCAKLTGIRTFPPGHFPSGKIPLLFTFYRTFPLPPPRSADLQYKAIYRLHVYKIDSGRSVRVRSMG